MNQVLAGIVKALKANKQFKLYFAHQVRPAGTSARWRGARVARRQPHIFVCSEQRFQQYAPRAWPSSCSQNSTFFMLPAFHLCDRHAALLPTIPPLLPTPQTFRLASTRR